MPTDPHVGVILERDAHPGARCVADLKHESGRCLCDASLPLSEALARDWDADAHVVCYRLEDEDGEVLHARANKRSPLPHEMVRAGMAIRSTIVCLDHDLPGHREWASIGEPIDWLASLPEGAPSPTVWYSTLHGSRFVYVLSEPVDRLLAEGLARALIARWAALGVVMDASCADWTRLFRLPRARRADTGSSFALDARFVLIDGGPELDPSSLPSAPSPAAEPFGEVVPYEGACPDADACEALLWTAGASGGRSQTELQREARKLLRGRSSFAVAFEDGPIDVSQGWDNGVLALVGQVCGMLATSEAGSPEGCLALIRGGLEQLSAADEQGRLDWVAVGWDKVRRMWSLEEARIEGARAERESAARQAEALKAELADRLRAERPDDVPADPAEARDYLSRRMVASDGRCHYVMRQDGSYNVQAVGDSMLVPMIRDLGMAEAIPVDKVRGNSLVDRGASEILNAHAVPIVQVRCSSRERVAHVEGDPGARVLRVPIHRLNPRLAPARSPHVEEWLASLLGPSTDLGLDWLAHALDTSAPICALNLYGTPGSGKGMLVLGLAECFDGEAQNDGRAMDRFNIGLLRSPLIACDEGVPMIRGLGTTADQVFRSLVAGGVVQVEGKMRDIIVAEMYPRIVFTSNNRDITRDIVGARDLSDDDVRAIEQRLLSIQVGPEARRLLTSRGNLEYTKGWVAGGVPSRYVLANHLAWLHRERRPSRFTTGRFLVEGESETVLVRDVRLRSEAAQLVLRALVRMLETPTPRSGLHVADGRAWVTVSSVVEYCEVSGMPAAARLSMPQVGQVLRQFSAEALQPERYVPVSTPPGAQRRGRWIELDLAMLLEECFRYGMECGRIEALLRQRTDGPGLVAEARVHGGAS